MSNQFIEKEVVIKGTYELAATLTIPEGNKIKYPAMVIVNGSGGSDRNGNQFGFKMNIYKQLSDFLAEAGFVTLRYDKRGIKKSEGDGAVTGMWDLIEDVKSSVEYLKTQTCVDEDKVILIGHSEGCILSTHLYPDCKVAGMILLSGAGVSLKTSMEEQLNALVNEISTLKGIKGLLLRRLVSEKQTTGKQKKLFERVLSTDKDTFKVQMQRFPAKWLREHLSYTDEMILDLLKSCDCPVLVATGDRDVQTNSDNLNRITELNNENISVNVIPDMDHLLKFYDGDKSILNIKKQYKQDIKKPIHPVLNQLIVSWCTENDF